MWPERAYFRLYHPKYPSKPASHFTNHKETTEDKVAGTGMFLSLHPRYPSKPTGHFTNHKGTTEDKVARMGMFSSLPYKASFKAHRSFFEPQRKNGRQCSRKGYVFIFTIQGILQGPPVILQTIKEQQKTEQPEWVFFHLYHSRCLSKPAGHFINHKGTREDKVAGMDVFSSLPSKVSFKA